MNLAPLVHNAAQLLHKQLPQLAQLCPLILGQGKRPLQHTGMQLSMPLDACLKYERPAQGW